ncbi:MAG: hypothetical protein HZB26_18225 [Candidatus Hydrogenedentes bacterium]|nr:hypothetical protein [Candidatus Hydrogenedentota bacterium]
MRKRRKATRNVILFLVAVLIMAGLIVMVGRSRHTVVIMPPESPDMVAKRQAPDNAYRGLEDAANAIPAPLPPKPPPGNVVTLDRRDERKRGLRTGQIPPGMEMTSMASRPRTVSGWFGFERDDNDPELAEYARQCEPVVGRVREASSKPYLLPAVDWASFSELPWNLYQEPPAFYGRLGRVVVGKGVYAIRVSKDPAKGVEHILTALRLGRMLEGDGPVSFYERAASLQREALQAFDDLIPLCPDDVLRTALKELDAMRRGIAPPPGILDFQWRVIDNVARLKMDQNMESATGAAADGRKIGVQLFFNTQMKSIRQIVAANREEFGRVAAMTYPESVAWKSAHRELTQQSGRLAAVNPLNLVNRLVVWRAVIETYYGGAEVAMALELYRRNHGGGAETLEALGAEFPDLPMDPFTGKPFLYKVQGNDCMLYSAGMNQTDDGGVEQDQQAFAMTLWYGGAGFRQGRGTDIVIHRPAPPIAPPAGAPS